jgi:dTDP-4-amino-4,6-dideoxygalactose transaminase
MCPVAESAYESLISLPMFAGMSDEDVEDVVVTMQRVIEIYHI